MPIIIVALRGSVTLPQTPPGASCHTWNKLQGPYRDPARSGPLSDLNASLDDLSQMLTTILRAPGFASSHLLFMRHHRKVFPTNSIQKLSLPSPPLALYLLIGSSFLYTCN